MNKIVPVIFGVGIMISGTVFAADIPVPQVYGRVHIAAGYVHDVDGSSNAKQIKSNASRFGVKGDIPISDDLKATYKLEWQVDVSDTDSSSDHIKGRDQYAGLKGRFGEVRVGRHDTSYKSATSALDYWSDSYADYANIISATHDIRADNTIIYLNKIDKLSYSLSHSIGDEEPGTVDDTENSATAIGATYTIGNLYIGGGYQDFGTNGDAFKIGATYTIDKLTFGGIIEGLDGNASVVDETNFILMVKYRITDKGTIQAMYGETGLDGAPDPTLSVLGYNHQFTKKVAVYVLGASASSEGMKDKSDLGGDAESVSVGLVINF